MGSWVDEWADQRVSQQADEHIKAQKFGLAVRAAMMLRLHLVRQLQTDVEEFSRKFPAHIMGPEEQANQCLRIRTMRLPLEGVDIMFVQNRIEFTRFRVAKLGDKSMPYDNGVVLVGTDFEGHDWIECDGRKLMNAEEVSRMLLTPVFDHAVPVG